MRHTNILNGVSRGLHKVGFTLQKHSPQILVGVGIVAGVAGTVLACKATTKANDILKDSKEQLTKIHTCMEDVELIESGKYTEKDAKKDLAIVYGQTGVKLAKVYGPSIILGVVSVTSILASHHILNKRNVALSAAYTLVDKSFKDYRKNVKERFGQRVDYELKHNIKAEEIEVKEIDENGNEVIKKQTIDVIQPNGKDDISDFAKFFDEYSPYWKKDPDYNLMFLKQTQCYANEKLRTQGHLFLNEVYEMLGIPHTKAGQIVGWIYNEKNPVGDNFVDFGIYDVHRKENREFVNGYERSILLDFNVDGDIWKLMP